MVMSRIGCQHGGQRWTQSSPCPHPTMKKSSFSHSVDHSASPFIMAAETLSPAGGRGQEGQGQQPCVAGQHLRCLRPAACDRPRCRTALKLSLDFKLGAEVHVVRRILLWVCGRNHRHQIGQVSPVSPGWGGGERRKGLALAGG